MSTYATIDYLPDLSATEKLSARYLSFSQFSSTTSWDVQASVYGDDNYAILHSVYRFTGVEGATYDFISTSYFDPFLLRVFDSQGNVIVVNDEIDDPSDFLIDGAYYSNDWIWNWKAPYSGEYFVEASWNQGSYFKFYSLTINADLDTTVLSGSINGSIGNDYLVGSVNDDIIEAGYGFDTVYGGLGNDYIQGGFNGDRIYGEDGNDDLRGGNGLDLVVGGAGNDIIRGAKGTDTLTGGSGTDVFIFATDLDGAINIDTITDFVSGTDRIELSAAVFTALVAQVGQNIGLNQNITYNLNNGVLSYDADGSGVGAGVAFAVLGADNHSAFVGTDFWVTA